MNALILNGWEHISTQELIAHLVILLINLTEVAMVLGNSTLTCVCVWHEISILCLNVLATLKNIVFDHA